MFIFGRIRCNSRARAIGGLTNEADQLWLEGEVAMLEEILCDTWFYQKILKEGREGGIEEGHEQERKRELQRWARLL